MKDTGFYEFQATLSAAVYYCITADQSVLFLCFFVFITMLG
jgi:hypothetical protein